MPNVNQIMAFATGAQARVLSPDAYAALAARVNGFVAGPADEVQLNTVWRQSSFVAAMVAQFTADRAKVDVLDNGDISTFENNFAAAIAAVAAGQVSGGVINIISSLKIAGNNLLFDQSVPGTYTFTIPSGVYTIKITIWGGGGAGGGSYGNGSAGTGGAGGGYSEGVYSVQPGQIVTIVVAPGGGAVAGSSVGGGNGNTGGTSSVSGNGITGLPIAATGGQGGGGALNSIAQFVSQPGQGSGGQTNRPGTGGGTGVGIPNGTPLSGVGGASFTTSIPGANQGTSGTPGNFPGGGGSGSSDTGGGSGGPGASGWVRIFG
jgi:hypothetical protein